MKTKEYGPQTDNRKYLEVNIDVAVEATFIYPWVDPETFGTPENNFYFFSCIISKFFALLVQQRENFEWIDSDSCFWIKKYRWASKIQVAWQIKGSQFSIYFQSLHFIGSGASVVISLKCKLISQKIWRTLDQFGSTSLWLPLLKVNHDW